MSHRSPYKCTNIHKKEVKNVYFVSTNNIMACICSCCLTLKMRMTLFWLLFICAERRPIPSVGLLAIVASTCINISVAFFGFEEYPCIGDKLCLLEFLDIFCRGVKSYLRSLRCNWRDCYMMCGITLSRKNNVNPYLFSSSTSFQLVHLPENEKKN